METIFSWFANGVSNWKTTLAGLVGGSAMILKSLNVVDITPDQQLTIIGFVLIVGMWFAKDGNKTGTVETGGE